MSEPLNVVKLHELNVNDMVYVEDDNVDLHVTFITDILFRDVMYDVRYSSIGFDDLKHCTIKTMSGLIIWGGAIKLKILNRSKDYDIGINILSGKREKIRRVGS